MLALDRILVSVDFSPASESALRRALDLAGRTGADLCLLHVVPGLSANDASVESLADEEREFYRRVWERAERDLDAFLHRSPPSGVQLHHKLVAGVPTRTILAQAEEEDADLIVMGTHGRRGMRRLVLGSVAETVLRQSERPVLVVPEVAAGLAPLFHVLAPTDFSDAAGLALPVAAEIADLYGARLDLLHVLEPVPLLGALAGVHTAEALFPELYPHAEERLGELVREGTGALGRATYHVVEGRAAGAVVDYAATHGVDLIVMAKHGWHGVERVLMGSATERICRTAPCAVLALPMIEED